jgi:malonyl CoA-acyl carrier protein transacylase
MSALADRLRQFLGPDVLVVLLDPDAVTVVTGTPEARARVAEECRRTGLSVRDRAEDRRAAS